MCRSNARLVWSLNPPSMLTSLGNISLRGNGVETTYILPVASPEICLFQRILGAFGLFGEGKLGNW